MAEPARSKEPEENAHLDTMVLPEALARRLAILCRKLQNWEVLKAQGIQVPGRILLYGPPGTGKTTLARIIPQESRLEAVASRLSDFRTQFIGQANMPVKDLFARARARKPCVLVVDEFDVSPDPQDFLLREIVMEFLMELDQLKPDDGVFFLVAAIDPTGIDQRLLSRFSERIEIPCPGQDERRRILQKLLTRIPNDFDVEQVAAEIAARPGLNSARDLEQLVRIASIAAIERADAIEHCKISREDLLLAMERK